MQGRTGNYKAGETPYYEAVAKALYAFASEGVTLVSYYDVAERIERHVTSSLRRAMDQADANGIVTRKNIYSRAGGLMAMFEIHLPLKQTTFVSNVLTKDAR